MCAVSEFCSVHAVSRHVFQLVGAFMGELPKDSDGLMCTEPCDDEIFFDE